MKIHILGTSKLPVTFICSIPVVNNELILHVVQGYFLLSICVGNRDTEMLVLFHTLTANVVIMFASNDIYDHILGTQMLDLDLQGVLNQIFSWWSVQISSLCVQKIVPCSLYFHLLLKHI